LGGCSSRSDWTFESFVRSCDLNPEGKRLNILKVHRLICGSMCPIGWGLAPRFTGPALECQCLLVETSSRLILVDTGLGTRDVTDTKRLGIPARILRPKQDSEAPAYFQLKQMGFNPEDVTDVIPSGWILHAGDAFYHSADLNVGLPNIPRPPWGFRAVQWLSHMHGREARQTQMNLRKLRHELSLRIICGHDGSEWDQVPQP
jgi:glyoxylase-like metal-dependent hydrolase (beta-lactamase superfamily II)